MQRQNVWMGESCSDLNLTLEAFRPDAKSGVHYLDGNSTPMLEIIGKIDARHSPFTDLRQDVIVRNGPVDQSNCSLGPRPLTGLNSLRIVGVLCVSAVIS